MKRSIKRLTLAQGFDLTHAGFRPAAVFVGGKKLEWALIVDLPLRPDMYGAPEMWGTDGHRIYFDKRADRDYPVIAEKP